MANTTTQSPGSRVCTWCGAGGNEVVFWHNFMHGCDSKTGSVFTLCDACFKDLANMALGIRSNSSSDSGSGSGSGSASGGSGNSQYA